MGKKIITIKNTEIYFAIYDSCSWEFYYRHQLLGYKPIKFNGYLLFFSLCNKFSFDSLDDCIRIYSEFGGKNVSNFPTLLIGTNSDEEERKVKSEEAINYAKKHNFIGYFEISSKTGENVYESFEFLVNSICERNIEKFKIKLRGDWTLL